MVCSKCLYSYIRSSDNSISDDDSDIILDLLFQLIYSIIILYSLIKKQLFT